MKWRQFVYSRKTEDNFLNNIKNVFGDDIVIAYRDWSRSSQMKHFMPTKNEGIRKLIAKNIKQYQYTNIIQVKKCSVCLEDLNYIKQNNKKPLDIYVVINA
jgi:hypothetical protein